MCLLSCYLPGARGDRAALECAARRNPDGFGWAMIAGDEIVTYRTLDPVEGVESFLEFRELYLDGHALWHSRLTTHGTTSLDNVHPFIVGNDERVVAAHNGVLPLDPTDGRSDTRVFAEDMMSAHYLDDSTVMEWVGGWAGRSKLAFLSVHPATRASLYIVNEHLGHWSSDARGVWYSNDSYREPEPRYWRPSSFVSSGAGWNSLDDSTLFESTLSASRVARVPLDLDDNLEDGLDAHELWLEAWDDYREGDPVVQCGECGEWWPATLEWCEFCGTSLEGETPLDVLPRGTSKTKSKSKSKRGGRA